MLRKLPQAWLQRQRKLSLHTQPFEASCLNALSCHLTQMQFAMPPACQCGMPSPVAMLSLQVCRTILALDCKDGRKNGMECRTNTNLVKTSAKKIEPSL